MAAVCAFGAAAAPRIYPAGGSFGGSQKFSLHGEPRREMASNVAMSTAEDHVSIDSRGAFAAGMTKLQINSGEIFDPAFRGRDMALVFKAGGSKGAVMNLYFMGSTSGGKTWYKFREVRLTERVREYSMIQGPIPDDLEKLHLRYDIIKPGKGTLEIYPS